MGLANGDAEGMTGIKRDYQAIRARENIKLIFHEFNLNAEGGIFLQQREWLKKQLYNGKLEWGVGQIRKDGICAS